MQQAATFATPANRFPPRRAWLQVRACASLCLCAVLAWGGCRRDEATTPREPAPRVQDAPSLPETRPVDVASPDDVPATRPELAQDPPASRPATQPSGERSAAQPATQPSTQPTTRPSTQPATQPTTQPTTGSATEPATRAAEASVPRLMLLENPTPASAALAEIMAAYATAIAGETDLSDAVLGQAIALQEAAVRLSPRDYRLAQQLVSLRMREGDVAGSLEALNHYRRLRPDDVLAQIRYLDLSSAQMESVDQKLEYLIRVAQDDRVPGEVRSHAAVMGSVLLRGALDQQRADLLLGEAVALDPYSPQALQMFYERLVETGEPRARRVDALAMLARSNILQPAVLSALAEEVASAGLVEQANTLYQRAGEVYASLGMVVPPEVVRDMASLQLVTNRSQSARQMLEVLEQRAPATQPADGGGQLTVGEMDALMLQPLVVEAGEARATAAARSANVIRARVLTPISRALAGLEPLPPDAGAADTPLPEVVADAGRLASEETDPALRAWSDSYAVALSNLAWLDLYASGQPTDDRVLEALALLVPPDSLALARLRGWQQWRQGQPDAARQALSPIADEDALAALGLLLMDAQSGEDVTTAAGELRSRHPAGLVGAFLGDSLEDLGARVMPAADEPDVRAALETLPMSLFDVLDPAKVRNFYSLLSSPRTVRLEYGQPVIVEVQIRNNGRHVLTLGPEGLLRQIVRLDAQVKGQGDQGIVIPAAAAVELWGAVRLSPGDRIEQAVRLDGRDLAAVLSQRPQQSLTISADVTVNPSLVQTEQGMGHVTGPAGQTHRVRGVMTRRGVPLSVGDPEIGGVVSERTEQLRGGEPLERLRVAQWAVGQLEAIRAASAQATQAGAPPEDLAALQQLADRIYSPLTRAGTSLSLGGLDASANAWVKYSAASVHPPGEARARLVRELLASSGFESRMVGLIAVARLVQDAEASQRLLRPIAESDADPTVQKLAQDLLTVSEQRPANRPATGPTTGPATLPAGEDVPGLAGPDVAMPPVEPATRPATQPATRPS